jgi:hypothetical protein
MRSILIRCRLVGEWSEHWQKVGDANTHSAHATGIRKRPLCQEAARLKPRIGLRWIKLNQLMSSTCGNASSMCDM